MKQRINVLSLFDGISCARVALDTAGIKVDKYFASEIDKYAIQIAQKNYPDTIQLGDVLCIHWDKIKKTNKAINIDLIIGGSPCQDLSIAKRNREGLKGCRSGLFYEFVRLVKEVKPKYFVLENVASMPREAKNEITKQLWNIEPIMINAALVSAQSRKRLFWLGELVDGKYKQVAITQPEDRGIFLKDILETGGVSLNKYGEEKLKANTIRVSDRGSGINNKHNWDTIRIGQIGKGGQGDRIYSPEGKSVNLSANGGGRGAKTGLYLVSEATKKGIVRKLTPIECERLQGLPDNFSEGVSNSQRYKMLGNGMNVEVIRHIFESININ